MPTLSLRHHILKSLLIVAISGTELWAAQPPEPGTAADIIPITMGNLRGHQLLYDEGWYVVTSSRRALEFAREKALDSSAEAMRRVRRDMAFRSSEYRADLAGGVKGAAAESATLWQRGSGISGEILRSTDTLARRELAYANESFRSGMEKFIKGNLSLGKRTEQERAGLKGLPGNYLSALKDDFSNIRGLTDRANSAFAGRIEPGWDQAFADAGQQFQEEYQRSGEAKNSLMALGPLLGGYFKAFYRGAAAPAAKSLVKGGATGAVEGVFLPVAGVTMVAGRTVQSAGMTVYYTGATAVKIVSPTVEGGLLSGLSLLALGAVPATYVTGGTMGAVNQVAFTAAAPGYGVARGMGGTGAATAKYVTVLAYDAVSGTTRVAINQARAGVVLGYNALTAIPAHLVTGAMDTAIFLAWDGPRLVVAAAGGR